MLTTLHWLLHLRWYVFFKCAWFAHEISFLKCSVHVVSIHNLHNGLTVNLCIFLHLISFSKKIIFQSYHIFKIQDRHKTHINIIYFWITHTHTHTHFHHSLKMCYLWSLSTLNRSTSLSSLFSEFAVPSRLSISMFSIELMSFGDSLSVEYVSCHVWSRLVSFYQWS